MFAPPEIFYQNETVELMKNSLSSNGYLIVNVVSTNDLLRSKVFVAIASHFGHSESIEFDEIYNELLICYD